MVSFAKYAPALIAGSAISGFGLSIGRDVYKKTKKYWPVMVILVCLVGVYYAGVWLFRNYRSVAGIIFKKFGALLVLILSSGTIYAVSMLTLGILAPETIAVDMQVLMDNEMLRWVTVAQASLFLIGALVGMRHRRRRRLAWEAEDHNEVFMVEHGLEVVDDDEDGLRLRDHSEGIGYRMMQNLNTAGELEFMALGKRNMRGYIHYDATGKYTKWSGLSEIR